MAYAQRTAGSYWSPAALAQPAVSYPAYPFAAPQAGIPPSVAGFARNRVPPGGDVGAGRSAEQEFGVKAGDWGGNTVFGVKSGDFGDPSPNTSDIVWKNHTINAGGGGMAGGGGGAGSLANYFQQALNNANQANEARYQDVLKGYQSRYERGVGMLAGLGQQEGRDVNELYDAQAASQRQSLVGRGLGNSTVLDTMLMGNERERNADLGRLNDRVRQQALTTDAGLSGDTLGFMERRNDTGPQMQMLAQLAQNMGAAGYGQPGAGMAGGGGGGGIPFANPFMGMPYFGGYTSPNAGYQAQRLANARANYANKNANSDLQAMYDWGGGGGGGGAPDWSPYYQGVAGNNAMAAQNERHLNASGFYGPVDPEYAFWYGSNPSDTALAGG